MHSIEESLRNVRFGLRTLRRRPGFALTAIITLSLGLGATTVIGSLVYGVLLQPLPFPQSDRLVSVGHIADLGRVGLTDGAFFVYGEESRSLEALSLYREQGLNLVSGSWVERASGASVDHTFFSTLRVAPALGRNFTAADDVPGAPPVAIISHGLWQRAFGGDPSAIGRRVNVQGAERELVGIMRAGFAPPREVGLPAPLRAAGDIDVWMPFRLDRARARSINFSFSGIGRLRGGVTAAQAQDDLDRLFARPFERYPGEASAAQLRRTGFRASVWPLSQSVVGDATRVIWTLLAAVALLLALACANVAMLVVLETHWRAGEIAVRRAVGANTGQLTRQFLVEGVTLSLLGAIGGLALGQGGIRLLVALAASQIPRLADVGLHPLVVAFTLGVSLAIGLAFAVLPVILQRPQGAAVLTKGAVAASGGTRTVPGRLRNGLVACQLALAVVLLTGAGLMLRTSWNLLAIDRGFRTDRLLLFNLTVSGPQAQNALAFHQQVLDRLEALPGVEAATASPFGVPIESGGFDNPVWVEGVPVAPDTLPDFHPFRIVMPGYFETLGITLVKGRPFDRRDIEQGTGAVVVNERFAGLFWPGRDAIGRRLRQLPNGPWFSIVGVVADTRDAGVAAAAGPMVYWPARGPDGRTYTSPVGMTYAVHTTGDPRGLIQPIRDAVRELAPAVPLASMRTMEEAQRRSMARVSFTMTLLAIGAAMALLVAAVGTYGVMAYMVTRRTREIGVRMALGASPGSIRSMVLNQGLAVTAMGLVAGLAGAAALTRFLQAFLFGVSPTDPLTYGAVSVLLLVAGAVACYIPARRATHVDPIVAVRAE